MKADNPPESAAFTEGYKAGYQKGFTDGISIGYSDAKARAWNAVDLAGERTSSVPIESLRRAMTTNVGTPG